MNTLAGYIHSQFNIFQYLEFLLRIFMAAICGAGIGLERTRRFKEAGLRTHIIVCVGAALAMILSKYGFADIVRDGQYLYGSDGVDASRIASQVISGISFLGAGVIFRQSRSVHGLTTAAGLWTTAIIGMTIGSGMYFLGICTTLIMVCIQIIMHKYQMGGDNYTVYELKLTVKNGQYFLKELHRELSMWHAQIVGTKIKRVGEGLTRYDITMRIYKDITIENLQEIFSSNDNVVDLDGLSEQ